MMVDWLIKRLKQVSILLFSYASVFPVISILLNITGFLLLVRFNVVGSEPEWLGAIDRVFRQISDVSLLGLLGMLVGYKYYRYLSWLSWISLLFIWIVNTIYQVNCIEADALYTILLSIIYITFVIGSVAKLTNRC